MTVNAVFPSFPNFAGTDGQPLEDGYIYIGQPGLNAEAAPKSAYWDAGLSIVAAQPIRTINGFPSRNGSPAMIYADGPFSILVQDKKRRLVYSALYQTAVIGLGALTAETFAELATGFGYTQTGGRAVVQAGDVVQWQGHFYHVLEADAVGADLDYTSSGGVKYDVLPGPLGYEDQAFGCIGDDTADDTAALQTLITAAAGAAIVFRPLVYRHTEQLLFNDMNVLFNKASFHWVGAPGTFAVVLNSNSGGGTAGEQGNHFDALTVWQDDFTEYTVRTGSAVYDPPSIAAGAAITNITPGGVSTTVTVSGATVGGYARATFTSIVDGVEVTAWVSAANEVTIHFSNYGISAVDMPSGTINVTVVNNAYHGLCISGVRGRVNAKVQGFTGVSVGFGDGRDPTSGVALPGLSRAYYWDCNLNVAPAAGWPCIIPDRNNVNNISLTEFPLNAYGDTVPRRAPAINGLVLSGIRNRFPMLSLECNPSEEWILIRGNANANEIPAGYLEYNTSWAVPPFPRVKALSVSSANGVSVRHPYSGGTTVDDKGVANNVIVVPSYVINNSQIYPPRGGPSFLRNGNFANGLTGWSDFSTGTTITYPSAGRYTGKRLRMDVVAGRPNILQAVQTVGLVPVSALGGQNVTIGCWIKTDIPGVGPRVDNKRGNLGSIGDGSEEFLTTTVYVPIGATTLSVAITNETSGVTGYVEVSDVSGVVGAEPIAYPESLPLVGSATYNPPSLTTGTRATTTVPVPGLEFGDFCTASFGVDLQGITLTAYVSAADTATVVFDNGTAGTLDLASSTLRVMAVRP